MAKTIFLDTGPLSLLTDPKRPPSTVRILDWSVALLSAGHRFMVPSIADFELRRELIRANKARSLITLDEFYAADPEGYLPLTDAALKQAARLWAEARNKGNLPGDVLIGAQVGQFAAEQGLVAGEFVVATVNVSHIELFIPAQKWEHITV